MYKVTIYSSSKTDNVIWCLDLGYRVKWKTISKKLFSASKETTKLVCRIIGAYKRTPRAVLEREAAVPPLDMYIEATAM
jgi:hypothetical protein